MCIKDVGMQCVVEHGVDRHLPYVVCVWEMEGVVHGTVIVHGVDISCYMLCVAGVGAMCHRT